MTIYPKPIHGICTTCLHSKINDFGKPIGVALQEVKRVGQRGICIKCESFVGVFI